MLLAVAATVVVVVAGVVLVAAIGLPHAPGGGGGTFPFPLEDKSAATAAPLGVVKIEFTSTDFGLGGGILSDKLISDAKAISKKKGRCDQGESMTDYYSLHYSYRCR